MVIPSLAPVYGRPEDDWAVVAARCRSRIATLALDNVEHPDFHAHALVDIDRLIIVEMHTPSWTAHLSPQSTRHDDLVAILQRAAAVVWDEENDDAS